MEINFENYIKEKKTINLLKANKLAINIFLLSAIIFGTPFYLLWKPQIQITWQNSIQFFLIFTVGIALHELIHGLMFGLYAKNKFKSIKFGILMEYLTPYCHCKEPLKLKHYIIGALMPALLIGVIPAIISLFTGSLMLLILGVIFISAAAGDFLVVWILRKEDISSYVLDHPSEAGCFIYHVP